METSHTLRHCGRILALIGVLFVSASAFAADSPTDELKLTADRVVVFKDGYYLAVKSGTAVTNGQGELHLLDVPDNAVLGSVWATSRQGKLVAMVASREEVRTTKTIAVPCTQPLEVLQANLGKKARIVMNDKTVIQGEIRQVLTETIVAAPSAGMRGMMGLPDAGPDELILAGLRAGRVDPNLTVSGVTGTQFILRTDEGDMLLPVGSIQSLTVKDMKSTLDRTLTTVATPKRLTLRFAEAEKKVDVSFLYFQPGLRWIPTYRIDLGPDAEKRLASLDLQAEFLNEAEDLENVPVDIVVGVPNFRFKDTPSPLVLEQAVRNALFQAAPHLMGQQLSNASFQARSGERFQQPALADAVPNLPPELGAVGVQDLFVYSLKSLSLRKGQRAAVPLLSAQVPYRSVYTWDVHLTRGDVEAAGPGMARVSPQDISENRVWHQIVLTNTTRVPWTTGAALLMQEGRPLSQDLLTYTSVGSDVRVPVTVSVDTQGHVTEEELERQLNALNLNEARYARIEKLARVQFSNRKAVPVDVEITFQTGGKVTEATDQGKITLNSHTPADWRDYHGHSAVNGSARVLWRKTIAPGESFAPTVKYQYFTRH